MEKEQWISIEDRLPLVDGLYYCYYKGHQNKLHFYNQKWYSHKFAIGSKNKRYIIKTVTHWMPLPEPPEVVKNAK